MKKRNIILVLIGIVFIGLVYFITDQIVYKIDSSKYFEDKEVTSALSKTLVNQERINSELEEVVNDKTVTFEDAKVIVNPYEISPLSALIYFYTEEEVSVNVTINGEYATKVEESNYHTVPIYGLKENYNNKVTLKLSDDTEKTFEIKTEKAENVNPLKVSVTSGKLNNDLYFFAGPMQTGASAYDKNGNLRWYLTEPYSMDFEWLENGHFLVGINEGSHHDRKIGFVEMDYLGKIYNSYTLQNGFEFEFQILENGNYLIAGGNEAVYYTNPYVYEVNSKNGKVESYVDLYEVFTKVDPDFDHTLNWTIIRNAFYLNEDKNELYLSLRGLNAIVCVDYEKNELKWVFSDADIWGEKFDDYMVELESGRYPKGQHGLIFTEEGYIGYVNNDYDRINGYEAGGKDLVSDWEGIYETAEIYSIKDKKATLVWSHGDNLDLFGQLYGNLYENNGNTIVSYGFVMKNSYRYSKGATLSESEATTKYSHALIYEIDRTTNKVLFKGTIEDAKYRTLKHSLYYSETSNTDISEYNVYNTVDETKLTKIRTKNIEKVLDSAVEFDNTFVFNKNVIDTDYTFNNTDKVEILFVGEDTNSYKFTYKNEDKSHINLFNINLDGKFAVYMIINDMYYDTKSVVEFE